jgi:class 3 adenylate cyclase
MDTRLVAVMLTDMSGYTEFSSRSDRTAIAAAVHQQQRLIAPVVDQFRGRIVKWIGDAALAVFPSAIDAILCGRRIQAAFVEHAERSPVAIAPRLKIVVHAGDAIVDADGDVYGGCVNFLARMEKAAQADEVYFSEAIRSILTPGEVPYEPVGEFAFSGIAEPARLFRTCFGQTPVHRERVALVQTNFTGIQDLADRHGWDAVHPALDAVTGMLLETARVRGGTNRGTLQIGSFFTFGRIGSAVDAARAWHLALPDVPLAPLTASDVGLRVGVHVGTIHVMKHTMMGRDIDIVRTLAALGTHEDVLFSGPAADAALAEGVLETGLRTLTADDLRECGSARRWRQRYAATGAFALARRDLLA